MKFALYITENSVPEWRTRYINYRKLKKLIKKCRVARERTPPVDGAQPLRSRAGSANSAQHSDDSHVDMDEGDEYLKLLDLDYENDESFFNELVRQIRKADRFYRERETEANYKFASIKQQCEILAAVPSSASASSSAAGRLPHIFTTRPHFGSTLEVPVSTVTNPDSSDQSHTEDSDDDNPADGRQSAAGAEHILATTSNPRARLIKATMEYYRFLELLKNFRVLNEIAVQKILKKFTKSTGISTERFHARLKQIHFMCSDSVERLISHTETLYADYIDQANDKRAAKKALRVPDSAASSKKRMVSAWLTGLMTGLALPPIVLVIRHIAITPASPEFDLLLQIYCGISVPILFLYLFALCLHIWDHFHINWVLIFELDARDYMSPQAFFELAAAMLLLFAYTMYLAVVDNFFGINRFLYAPMRIVFSGWFEVQFRDFFLCDLMLSMTYSFVAFQNVFCIVSHLSDPVGSCSVNTSLGASIATALPATWRLLQCLRRFYDHRTPHPHLSNAVKYVVSLTVIVLSTVSRYTSTKGVYNAWIAASAAATIYSYSWDVLYDWGLLVRNKNNPMLRSFVIYPKWVYFSAMGANAVLRLGWVFLLAPSYWSIVTDYRFIVYGVALLEVFRRFFWAIIRMENEHSNNVGRFRAVKELPLPFRINIQVPLTSISTS
nr:Xenotropic and polytropic retrovirus receptor 1 [Polyrhizophydium stewartii]